MHEGWKNQPYKSDFVAKWGTIKLEDIYDGTGHKSIRAAADEAKRLGFEYMISPKPSKSGNKLFRVTPSWHGCVYAMLGYLRHAAERNKRDYNNDIAFKVAALLKGAKKRSEHFDLTADDIIARIERGSCEATGMPFDTTRTRGPFCPSLDQIVPGAGYTCDNVQVVCLIYNQMKSDFTPSDVTRFIEHLKSRF